MVRAVADVTTDGWIIFYVLRVFKFYMSSMFQFRYLVILTISSAEGDREDLAEIKSVALCSSCGA
eukprot:2225307-Pleurochrysis_carterae.AAC.1